MKKQKDIIFYTTTCGKIKVKKSFNNFLSNKVYLVCYSKIEKVFFKKMCAIAYAMGVSDGFKKKQKCE